MDTNINTLSEASSDIICTWRLNGSSNCIAFLGKQALEVLLGQANKQYVLQLPVFLERHCRPEDIEDINKRLELALAGEITMVHEHMVLNTETQEWQWAHVEAEVIEVEGRGKVLTGIMRQCDKNMPTYPATQADSYFERLRVMIDAMPICCNFWNSDYENIDCNQEALRLFGMSSRQEYLKSFNRLMPEYQPDGTNSQDALKAILREAFKNGHARTEWMHQHKNGTQIPADITLIRSKWGGKNIVVAYARDLRDQYAAEAARRETEERMRIMLNAMPVCCVFWDSELNVLDCNAAAMRMFGFKNKKEYIKNILELMPKYQPNGAESLEASNTHMQAAFKSGYEHFEWTYLTPDGRLIPTDVTLVRVNRPSGPIVVSYISDLSEIKTMINAMQKSQLDSRLAKEEAERCSRVKSEFLANMSHEIRTPMNAIVGMLHLLQNTDISTKQKDYLNKAKHSADLLLGIIGDILDFSKIEAGKLMLESTPFQLNEILRGVTDIMAPHVEKKRLTLTTSIAPGTPNVLIGDPVRLEQIILNLVNNAVKFSEHGTVSVHVERSENEKALLLFTIKDEGIGMHKQQVASLFKAFTQGDNSFTRQYGGTGLGLTIAKSLIEMMHGKIWCESTPGVGSTFYFTARFEIPLQTAASTDHNLIPVKRQAELDKNIYGLRVLLAEDNAVNQFLATELLENKGINIDVVSNGLEAIDMVNKNEYDLILMDIQMPEMDGISATQKIRLDPRFASLPIIAVTAHTMPEDKEQILACGMNDHITKPIVPDVLYKTIEKWVLNKQKLQTVE